LPAAGAADPNRNHRQKCDKRKHGFKNFTLLELVRLAGELKK
jgi:hypothetical protein